MSFSNNSQDPFIKRFNWAWDKNPFEEEQCQEDSQEDSQDSSRDQKRKKKDPSFFNESEPWSDVFQHSPQGRFGSDFPFAKEWTDASRSLGRGIRGKDFETFKKNILHSLDKDRNPWQNSPKEGRNERRDEEVQQEG
jgi:hypothetical protein